MDKFTSLPSAANAVQELPSQKGHRAHLAGPATISSLGPGPDSAHRWEGSCRKLMGGPRFPPPQQAHSASGCDPMNPADHPNYRHEAGSLRFSRDLEQEGTFLKDLMRAISGFTYLPGLGQNSPGYLRRITKISLDERNPIPTFCDL